MLAATVDQGPIIYPIAGCDLLEKVKSCTVYPAEVSGVSSRYRRGAGTEPTTGHPAILERNVNATVFFPMRMRASGASAVPADVAVTPLVNVGRL